MTRRAESAAATAVGGLSNKAANETTPTLPSALRLNVTPSVQQVADAIFNHYGPHTVGAMEFDDLRDATMWRNHVAARLLKACRHDVRSALACVSALSMETAFDTPFDAVADLRTDTDADGELRIVALEGPREPSNRVTAWTENPRCVHCGEPIDDPRDAGALYGTIPLRVAHIVRPGTTQSCFVGASLTMRNAERLATIIPRALHRAGVEIR